MPAAVAVALSLNHSLIENPLPELGRKQTRSDAEVAPALIDCEEPSGYISEPQQTEGTRTAFMMDLPSNFWAKLRNDVDEDRVGEGIVMQPLGAIGYQHEGVDD